MIETQMIYTIITVVLITATVVSVALVAWLMHTIRPKDPSKYLSDEEWDKFDKWQEAALKAAKLKGRIK